MGFIAKHKFLFYLIQFTWGLPVNVIGFLVFLALLPFSKGHAYFHNCVYTRVGHHWGGFSLGMFIVTNEDSTNHTDCHESGHTLQVLFMGVFYFFLVAIPSFARYCYRRYLTKVKKRTDLPPYDSVWFEGTATKWGTEKY